MKNFLKILGVILIIVGSIMANFTAIPVLSYSGIAVSALGLALTIATAWNSATEKTWKEIVTIICFAVGGLLCGFAGMSEELIAQVILAVSGVVVLIIGLITGMLKKETK